MNTSGVDFNFDFDFGSARCLFCGSVGLAFENRLRDDDEHWAAKCKSCGYIQLAPLPTAEEEERYYQTNALYSISNMDESDLVSKLSQLVKFQCEILKRVAPPPADLMEIGSGYGLFLEEARAMGYNVSGIELSEDKIAFCKNRTGIEARSINLITQDLPDELSGKYDVVAMFFLLEHIIEPVVFLRRCAKPLKRGGRIVALVPNMDALMSQFCSQYRDFHYLRPHISYFKIDTLTNLFKASGFQNVEVFAKQQYSVENAIHWARNKKPFLGYSQIEMPRGLEFVNEFYKAQVEKEFKADMLVVVAGA